MPRDDGDRVALPHDGDRLLADGEVVTRTPAELLPETFEL